MKETAAIQRMRPMIFRKRDEKSPFCLAHIMPGSPTLSPDGRYVTFESFATNLIAKKTDGPKGRLIPA